MQYYISAGLFVLLFVVGYIHSTKGIDLTDEGMYISSPFRYSRGDIPFQDDVMNLARPFDILFMPVFQLFPDISLLEIRLMGLLLQLTSLITLFAFFSRYTSPVVVSLCCTAMFFWSDPYNIISPSYNTMSRDFSAISLTLWLYSLTARNRYSATMYSVLGGFLLVLACFSYYSQGALILVPVLFVLFCLLLSSRMDNRPYIRSSLAFVIAFVLIAGAGIFMAAQSGVSGEYLAWLNEMTETNDIKILGPQHKLGLVLVQLADIFPRGLLLIAIGVIVFLTIAIRRKDIQPVVGVLSIVFLLLSFLCILLKSPLIVLLGFTIPLALPLLCLPLLPCQSEPLKREWLIVRNTSILWGLLSVIIFSVSSGDALKNGLLGSAVVYLVVIISLHRMIKQKTSTADNHRIREYVISGLFPSVICAFILAGLYHLYDYRYRESDITRLTARFQHPKLAGIYSTPQKVNIVEDLLHYLENRIDPHGYFLAYNSIPLLYFLTHTRPSLAVTWARDDWPLSTRQRLLDKMVKENRLPEYCVRMLALPEGDWTKEMPYDAHSPLDNFIQSNYYIEKMIYPFQIWRRGAGPKYRVYDDKAQIFQADYSDWKDKGKVDEQGLSDLASPLIRLGDRGKFTFTSMPENGIRIVPTARNEKNECEIQFGYSVGENGFEINLAQGQTAVLMLEARLDGTLENTAALFIQDRSEGWERYSASIYKYAWEQYIISKKIRAGSTNVHFGIYWKPKSDKDSLEIRNLRILVEEDIDTLP